MCGPESKKKCSTREKRESAVRGRREHKGVREYRVTGVWERMTVGDVIRGRVMHDGEGMA